MKLAIACVLLLLTGCCSRDVSRQERDRRLFLLRAPDGTLVDWIETPRGRWVSGRPGPLPLCPQPPTSNPDYITVSPGHLVRRPDLPPCKFKMGDFVRIKHADFRSGIVGMVQTVKRHAELDCYELEIAYWDRQSRGKEKALDLECELVEK